jgi:predicted RecB family nuclease
MTVTITTDLIEAYLKCPTKCFLLSRQEVATGNAYADWARTKSTSYCCEGIQRLVARVPPDKCVTSTSATERTRAAKWQLAIDFKAGSRNLQCSCHAVERIPSLGRDRGVQFIPIRFVFRNKLIRDDKLLIAFDALVLSEMLGRTIDCGKILHGDNYATLRVKTSALADDVRRLIEKIDKLLASSSPPDLVLNRHCAECKFQTRCRQKAIDHDDLSLLGSMAEKERAEFNSRGIFTVTQLSYTFRPRRRPKELKDKRERHHHSLKARAIREGKIYVVGSPKMQIEGTPVYLDVEGLPDRDFYYLIGIRVRTADSTVQHSFWADSPSDEGRIWQEFLLKLAEVEKPILIHYGSFESIFLKRMRERHGAPPDGLSAGKAIDSPINLLSVIFGQIYFPTHSNRLKEIAGWSGFKWSAQEASGLQAIIWRDDWEQTRNPLVKEELVRYNLEDCAALELVTGAVRQTFQQDIRSNSETRDRLDVVAANNVECKGTMWPKFSSSIEGYETINRAARWDYQRDRIYIRTEAKLKRSKREGKSLPRRNIRISKAVVCEPSRVCPRCQRKGTQEFRKITKCLQDLRFSRFGVSGSVVKYKFQVSWCPACRAFTPWPRVFWERSTFGNNLAAFVIFEIIELCVSQRSVTHTLNRLFGFRMDEIVVRRFKTRGAGYYQETRQNILAKMVKGDLIHADETRIKLHDKTAYVWVFATWREVVYFYSETREGSFVQSALQEFTGVLVSDFYAAYDSISCPQQKCILHLIRDFNDAVLDNPYDESIKGIATTFAELFREIVKTTDRWGLRSRFLRKHLADVARFYKRVSKMEHLSTVALKLKTRLDKDRDKLFTFLNYDGIPWNNNNAEHAIKAFARLRRAIEGLSTPRGIEEYLILLSVCQTCKYSGLDFLDFLRSGEKDIGTFAVSQPGRHRHKADLLT